MNQGGMQRIVMILTYAPSWTAYEIRINECHLELGTDKKFDCMMTPSWNDCRPDIDMRSAFDSIGQVSDQESADGFANWRKARRAMPKGREGL